MDGTEFKKTGTSVVIYFETGFDNDNVPDSQALVAGMAHISLTGMAMRQGLRSEIRVEITDSQAERADYCMINDGGYSYFYFVQGFNKISAKTYVLSLGLDALTTANALSKGSFSIDGRLRRRIKPAAERGNTDIVARLQIDDGFTPSYDTVHDYQTGLVGAGGSFYNMVHSTTDLLKDNVKAKKYIEKTTDNKTGDYVLVPQLNDPTPKTEFTILGASAETSTYSMAGLGLYDGNNKTVTQSIMSLWSLGIDAIKNAYALPAKYAQAAGTGFYSQVNSGVNTVSSSLSLVPGSYQPENYKAALLNQRITLISTASGDSQTFSLSQINAKFDFTYWADPTPDGRPYIKPSSLNGNDSLLYGTVAGGKWLTTPYAMPAAITFGGAQQNAEYNMDKWERVGAALSPLSGISASQVSDTANDFIDGAAVNGLKGGMLASKAGVVGMGMSAGLSAIPAAYHANRAVKGPGYALDVGQRLREPDIKFTTQPGLQAFFGNDFNLDRERLDSRDIKQYDLFLHKYGEAVDESVEESKVYANSNYDYIQVESPIIISDKPKYIREQAKVQLSGGVRVWHSKPSLAALKIGGN